MFRMEMHSHGSLSGCSYNKTQTIGMLSIFFGILLALDFLGL
jgi:hypothetical protein